MAIYDDAIVLSAVAAGDQKAFAELFNRYKGRTYTIALALTEDPVIAEELVQDVFVRVWKNRQKLGTLDNFASWLYTITRNRAITALQKIAKEGKKRAEYISHIPLEISDAEKHIDDQYMHQLLTIALGRLSKQQRRVFELCRLQGYSREEAAEELGLAPATVSVHLTIAIRSVRALLTSRIDSPMIALLIISCDLL